MNCEEDESITLPKSWRTLAHLRAQMRSSSFVRELNASPSSSFTPTAIVMLHNFFSPIASSKKRPRCASATLEGNGRGGVAGPPASVSPVDADDRCCSAAMRRAAHAALAAVRASMGSADSEARAGAALILCVQLKPSQQDTLSRTSNRGVSCDVWHVIGLCVSETITNAYHLVCTANGSVATFSSSNNGATVSRCAETTHRCSTMDDTDRRMSDTQTFHDESNACVGSFCGIRLIWVASASRCRGVAFTMVEVARRCISYGHVFARSEVAFSEPTPEGCRFARRYLQSDTILIYFI